MHVLVVESGILDHNATVGETHAFPLTLTPIVATIQKCCVLVVANGILDHIAPVSVEFPLALTPIVAMSQKCMFWLWGVASRTKMLL